MAELVTFVRPRPKRTHAEVLAANAQAGEKIAEGERERQQLIDRLAVLDAQHAKALADEEENAVYSLNDVPDEDETQNESMLEITQEDFDHIEDNRELAQSHREPPGSSLGMRWPVAPQPFPHLVAVRWLKYDIICAPYAHP
jgi:3-methyladenine DNA glycosylase/8-oxoguanine DNA glycosylase